MEFSVYLAGGMFIFKSNLFSSQLSNAIFVVYSKECSAFGSKQKCEIIFIDCHCISLSMAF
jgi:hypothetical protein